MASQGTAHRNGQLYINEQQPANNQLGNTCRFVKWEIKGCYVWKNLSVQLHNTTSFFQGLEITITTEITPSLIHWEIEGHTADFQCNSIQRLASKEAKAVISFCVDFSWRETSESQIEPSVDNRAIILFSSCQFTEQEKKLMEATTEFHHKVDFSVEIL